MSVELVMPSSYLILCCLLLLLPPIYPSIRVFSNESVLCIRWPKYWSSSFSVSPSNEYSGLISLRRDRLDFLAIQGTLKSLLQYHSSNASILQCSAFFIVESYWIHISPARVLTTCWIVVHYECLLKTQHPRFLLESGYIHILCLECTMV